MKYKNGFYIYTPREDKKNDMCELSFPQVIEIKKKMEMDESEAWLTGYDYGYELQHVESMGVIGKMVMSQSGEIISDDNKELARDKERIDWLADVKNNIGNVQLPADCVMNNVNSLRGAIDEAMNLKGSDNHD